MQDEAICRAATGLQKVKCDVQRKRTRIDYQRLIPCSRDAPRNFARGCCPRAGHSVGRPAELKRPFAETGRSTKDGTVS